ncbi:MAG: PIN domain-containing protein [Candidatus Bipolaricaulota bacterium]|nr:PIN domain-containing protein [Candidatus Bipolaricaulota bacterium]MDW8110917.1 PIN domain-containing protein [Candidatus Bipolaricaulota bacterium]MDW8329122.1 PIN domain-containing protein [Candidatus Bipolaricaulota bacterium]
MTIFDTDSWLTFSRGDQVLLNCYYQRYITVVNLIELYQGAPDKKTLRQIKRFVRDSFADVLTLSPATSLLAIDLIERYALPSGLRLADAFIAAIALNQGATLVSGNYKHFRDIEVPAYQRQAP